MDETLETETGGGAAPPPKQPLASKSASSLRWVILLAASLLMLCKYSLLRCLDRADVSCMDGGIPHV